MSSLIEQHDELLKTMPEGAVHENCDVCLAKLDNPEGGVERMTTYSDKDLIDAVQAAVGPLKDELDSLKASQAQEAIDARIAEVQATAEADAETKVQEATTAAVTQAEELQGKLDLAEAEANTAKQAYEDLVAYLETGKAEAEQAALIETRRSDRKAAVAELGVFTEEQIDAKLDRWVAQEDDVFTDTLEDLKEIAAKAGKTPEPVLGDGKVPTAMDSLRPIENLDDRASMFASVNQMHREGKSVKNL